MIRDCPTLLSIDRIIVVDMTYILLWPWPNQKRMQRDYEVQPLAPGNLPQQ